MIRGSDIDDYTRLRKLVEQLRKEKLDLRKSLFTLKVVVLFSVMGNVLLIANTYIK